MKIVAKLIITIMLFLFIVLSMIMVFHYHNDEKDHKDCVICLLAAIFNSILLPENIIIETPLVFFFMILFYCLANSTKPVFGFPNHSPPVHS